MRKNLYVESTYIDPSLEKEKDILYYLGKDSIDSLNIKKDLNKALLKEWENRQPLKYLNNKDSNILTLPLTKGRKTLRLFKGLKRYKGTLLTQLRTNRIGLNSFLYSIRAKESPYCPECLEGKETPRHIIIECPYYRDKRSLLREKINTILKRPANIPLDLKGILENPLLLPTLLEWFLSLDKLD